MRKILALTLLTGVIMAHFGTAKYSTFLYGAQHNDIAWELVVDWDRDGAYDLTNEAQFMTGLTVSRGRSQMLKDDGAGFEPIRDGRMVATMYDPSRRYDPYNAASPLFPNIKPGAKFRLRVQNHNTGTWYNVMVGDILEVRPNNAQQEAVLVGVDRMAYLRKIFLRSSLQTNWDPTTILDAIISVLGWTDGRTVDAHATRQWAYWWLDPEKSVLANIQELADSALDKFFIAADGKMIYYLRDYAPGITAGWAGADILKDPEISMPWENLRNDYEILVYPRLQESTVQEVWRLGEVYYIQSPSSIEVYSHNTYSGQDAPSNTYAVLVAGTHYTANTLPDGSGIDKTASLSITPEAQSPALSRKYTLSNTSGVDFYVTLFKITAKPTYYAGPLSRKALDAASIAAYGTHSMRVDNIFNQENTYAGLALIWMANLATPKPSVRVRMVNNYALQFEVDLFEQVSLGLVDLGIADNFNVAEIEHEWISKSGSDVMTTFRLEPTY